MRELLKSLLRKMYLYNFAKGLIQNLRDAKQYISWHVKRDFSGVDRALIDDYFAEQEIKKLHIGCGENVLKDWLNSDFFPELNTVLHLDATKTFPFPNDTFDYIFSEHMIEHIPYSCALSMLKECHRVLKNNGIFRISTPSLRFLIDLTRNDKTDLQKNYIKWATDTFIKEAPYYDETFVLNNFVRDWGHKFIYDEKTLRLSMENAGFTKIVKCDLNKSQDTLLQNLENEKRMPKGFLALETFTLEGSKAIDSQQIIQPDSVNARRLIQVVMPRL